MQPDPLFNVMHQSSIDDAGDFRRNIGAVLGLRNSLGVDFVDNAVVSHLSPEGFLVIDFEKDDAQRPDVRIQPDLSHFAILLDDELGRRIFDSEIAVLTQGSVGNRVPDSADGPEVANVDLARRVEEEIIRL